MYNPVKTEQRNSYLKWYNCINVDICKYFLISTNVDTDVVVSVQCHECNENLFSNVPSNKKQFMPQTKGRLNNWLVKPRR